MTEFHQWYFMAFYVVPEYSWCSMAELSCCSRILLMLFGRILMMFYGRIVMVFQNSHDVLWHNWYHVSLFFGNSPMRQWSVVCVCVTVQSVKYFLNSHPECAMCWRIIKVNQVVHHLSERDSASICLIWSNGIWLSVSAGTVSQRQLAWPDGILNNKASTEFYFPVAQTL